MDSISFQPAPQSLNSTSQSHPTDPQQQPPSESAQTQSTDPQPAPTRRRKTRWATDNDDTHAGNAATTALNPNPTGSNFPDSTTPSIPTGSQNSSDSTYQSLPGSLLITPPPSITTTTTSSSNDSTSTPTHPRISRWSLANIHREKEILHDISHPPLSLLQTFQTTLSLSGSDAFWNFSIPQRIYDQLQPSDHEKIAVLHLLIRELHTRLQNPLEALKKLNLASELTPNGSNGLHNGHLRPRSPSPEPIYDQNGVKVNTRSKRFADLCTTERNKLIEQMFTYCPQYQAQGYKKQRPFRNIPIPVDQYPNYNFSGLLIGPRGATQRRMETDYRCKISVRGRLVNDVKGKKNNEWSEDPPHVHIEGNDVELVEACGKAIEQLLIVIPDEENQHKKHQLMELSRVNGIYQLVEQQQEQREKTFLKNVEKRRLESGYKGGVDIICSHCGGQHLDIDCQMKDVDFQSDFEKHQRSLMVGNDFDEGMNNGGVLDLTLGASVGGNGIDGNNPHNIPGQNGPGMDSNSMNDGSKKPTVHPGRMKGGNGAGRDGYVKLGGGNGFGPNNNNNNFNNYLNTNNNNQPMSSVLDLTRNNNNGNPNYINNNNPIIGYNNNNGNNNGANLSFNGPTNFIGYPISAPDNNNNNKNNNTNPMNNNITNNFDPNFNPNVMMNLFSSMMQNMGGVDGVNSGVMMNANNNNNMSNINMNNNNHAKMMMNNNNMNNNNNNNYDQSFLPPPPPVGSNNNNNNNNNNNPQQSFLPPPPPGGSNNNTNNKNNNINNNNNVNLNNNRSFSSNEIMNQYLQDGPTKPGNFANNTNNNNNNNNVLQSSNPQQQQQQENAKPDIDTIYNDEYKAFWSQYVLNMGAEPTQKEWFQHWAEFQQENPSLFS